MAGRNSPRRNQNSNLPLYCTVLQIRYSCGHTLGGEFVKCRRHINKEDERCSSRWIMYIEAKRSPHKCRQCLRSG